MVVDLQELFKGGTTLGQSVPQLEVRSLSLTYDKLVSAILEQVLDGDLREDAGLAD